MRVPLWQLLLPLCAHTMLLVTCVCAWCVCTRFQVTMYPSCTMHGINPVAELMEIGTHELFEPATTASQIAVQIFVGSHFYRDTNSDHTYAQAQAQEHAHAHAHSHAKCTCACAPRLRMRLCACALVRLCVTVPNTIIGTCRVASSISDNTFW